MPPADATPRSGTTRRDPPWLWILVAALLVARVATGIQEERHPPRRADLMRWVPAAEAPGRALASGRPILYDFSAEWCGPCQRMQHEVFGDQKLANTIAQFVVPVHVVDRQQEDGHNPALVDSLQRAFRVNAFPTLVMVGADGKALDRMEGYNGSQELVKWVTQTGVKARIMNQRGAAFPFP